MRYHNRGKSIIKSDGEEMNNGREIILNKIRKQRRGLMIAGIIMAVIGLGIDAILLWVYIDDAVHKGFDHATDGAGAAFVCMLILAAIGVGGVFMIKSGLKGMKNPENDKILKKNPDLLFMADELYRGITYQDKHLIMSDRVIANKKNLYQMAFYNEVFMVYVHTESYNFVTTTKQLVLATARDEITFSIYGMKSEKVEELARTIAGKCPYARFGYTQENLRYLDEMRKVWQRAKLDQQMGVSAQQVERQAQQKQQAIQSGQQSMYNPDSTYMQ